MQYFWYTEKNIYSKGGGLLPCMSYVRARYKIKCPLSFSASSELPNYFLLLINTMVHSTFGQVALITATLFQLPWAWNLILLPRLATKGSVSFWFLIPGKCSFWKSLLFKSPREMSIVMFSMDQFSEIKTQIFSIFRILSWMLHWWEWTLMLIWLNKHHASGGCFGNRICHTCEPTITETSIHGIFCHYSSRPSPAYFLIFTL